MIKNDQLTFKELPPPILNKILTLKQAETELIYEHWRYLMAAIEVQSIIGNSTVRNAYVLYKSQYNLGFMNFQEGCMLYQRKFKIIHAQSQEITSLKLHLINIKYDQVKKKELLVGIGFFNGSCEVYNLIVTEKSVMLKKLIFLQNIQAQQPITSIVFNRKSLYLAKVHTVVVVKDLLTAAANIIIQDELSKGGKSKENTYKFVIEQLPLQNLIVGATITISTGLNNLYAFNQTQGAKAIDYQSLKISGSIIDSLIAVRQTFGQNLVLGDASNFLKIIYHGKNYVQRFTGFKNYCSVIDHVLFPTHEEIWVGDFYGSVAYFQRYLGKDDKAALAQLKMVEFAVKYSVRVCQNGIKEMRVIGKLMFVLDTEGNIHAFDIIRKDALQHLKTVQLESVEEYSSNQS